MIGVANALGQSMGENFAWFMIVSFIICLVLSIFTLIYNATSIKGSLSKAKHIVGMVFSGISLMMSAIFVIYFFAIYASAVQIALVI